MPTEAYWYYSSQGEAVQVAEKLTQRCTPQNAQEDQDHD